MVTWTIRALRGKRRLYCEGDCLSTDDKPVQVDGAGIFNGSKLREMDTGKDFRFNQDADDWLEQPSSGGGGTGGCAIAMTDVSTNGM